MKTLADIRRFCTEEREIQIDRLIEGLEEITEFQRGHVQGAIAVYENVIESVRHALKRHECEYLGDRCVLCGETAEAV